jgi:hypothetical protein
MIFLVPLEWNKYIMQKQGWKQPCFFFFANCKLQIASWIASWIANASANVNANENANANASASLKLQIAN